ncbi:uncharacterized protein [Solanum tuberosum]|uniref:uncharacterized protein n=1 Tax=Solanum tuberosum TaxID=4113 RepID=UPI00073A464A|nr:PREDICTED: uncharacterized protein LOC102594201 [Solanum tuberosum]
MSNLSKLEFVALDISENNYLSWVLDVEIHLDAKGLGATITIGNTTSSQDKAKAMIFLRHHLDEGLKVEYLTVKDPLELWTGLKERHWKNECRAAEHFVRLYQDSLKRKGNKNGASSSNARVESHLTYKNDAETEPSQKYDDNIEANLALKDDNFDDLDDITQLEVEDFFGDQN